MRGAAISFLAAILVCLTFVGWAVEPQERLTDPALEARARIISKELRCLVCQNQSIDDSNADLARDLRHLVRERLVKGDSDEEVLEYIVDRYGEFVLLRPPFGIATWALWFFPAMILAIGAGMALFWFRRRSREGLAQPLNSEEKARLDEILRRD